MMAVEAQFAGASFQEGKPVCNCDESSHCYRFLGPRSLLLVGSCSPQRTNDSFSFLNPIVTQIPSAPAPRADVVARLVCIQLSNSSPKNGRIGHPKELRVVAVPGCQQGSAFAAFLREPAKLPGCLKLRSFKRSCLSSGEGRKGLRLCPGPYSKSVGPALVAFAPVRNSTEFFYRHTSSWKWARSSRNQRHRFPATQSTSSSSNTEVINPFATSRSCQGPQAKAFMCLN